MSEAAGSSSDSQPPNKPYNPNTHHLSGYMQSPPCGHSQRGTSRSHSRSHSSSSDSPNPTRPLNASGSSCYRTHPTSATNLELLELMEDSVYYLKSKFRYSKLQVTSYLNTNRKIPGHCVIVNEHYFEPEFGTTRQYTDNDAEALANTFAKLGFQIDRRDSISRNEMYQLLDECMFIYIHTFIMYYSTVYTNIYFYF